MIGCSELRSDWLRRVSHPRRGIISIEKQDNPDHPRIANSPQGFHFGAFYESPTGNREQEETPFFY
jgi:hypothetical protein